VTAPVGRMLLVALAIMAMLLVPASTAGQAPGTPAPAAATTATTLPMVGSGDSRSDGEGPGIVGSPVAIAVGVVVLGVLTAVGTMLVLRVSGSRRGGT
jgi:hypothetical protein